LYIPTGGNLTAPLACPAGKYCPGGGPVGTPSVAGVDVVDCAPGTASGTTGQASSSACAACAAGTFAAAATGAAACAACAPGWTSAERSTSCATECEHLSAPASCAGIYTFAGATGARATTGCYFGSYATLLTGGAWVNGSSACTACAPGTVSDGWAAAGDAAGSGACASTTLAITSLACAGGAVRVTFGGGESRPGVAPTSADVADAQLELDGSGVAGGTLEPFACTASSAQGGVFTCGGVALQEGNICAADGAAPVGSLSVSGSAAYGCSAAGAVSATFSAPGANYAAATQVSAADLAFISGYAPPAGVVAPAAPLSAGDAASSPQPGYCYLNTATGSTVVTCYGYAPAAGYGCASATGAVPVQCAAGAYANNGTVSQSRCIDCGPSTYSAAVGAAACTTCPAGSSSSTATGNAALSTCIVSAGFFIAPAAASGAATTTTCTANSYCPGGGAVGTASVAGVGIIACPSGTTTAAQGGASLLSECAFPSPPPSPVLLPLTPPSPPPRTPPPKPPPPAGVTVFAVTAGVQLAGLSLDLFSQDAVTAAFVSVTAASVATSPSNVAITAVAAVTATTTRRLQQSAPSSALQVDFQVLMLSASAASGVSARITASGGPSLAALQTAGVPTTGVVLTTPPAVTVTAAPPAPPAPAPPPPAPPPPAGCGSTWFCFAGVACASDSTCGACPVGTAGDGVACAACSLSVTITPSFAGSSSASAADATLAGVVAARDSSCNVTGGFAFAWSAAALAAATGGPLQLSSAAAAAASFSLPARSLRSGQDAGFTLTACLARAAAPTCGNASASFAVTASPLVALLGGGGGIVGETPFTLSGAASYDPDAAAGSTAALSYAWTCARLLDGSSAACAAHDGTPVVLSAGAAAQSVQLAGAAAPGARYLFTLTVSDGAGRSSSTNTTVTVLPGALPLVSIAGSAALSGAKADPTKQLVLLANATAFVPGAVTTRWSLAAQSGGGGAALNLSDPAVCATPVTSASMVLRPGALAPGGRYTFTLTATDAAGGVGSANASVVTSAAPRGGWVDVSPPAGVALSTQFVLTAAGWSADADELPLTFAAEYTIDGSGAPPVSLTGGAFQASPIIAVQLPAGLASAGNAVTLRLTARSAFGATAAAAASAVVTWPVFADAAAAAAFVGDGAARAAAALQSGDATSALQVVGGLAALLNSNATSSSGSSSADSEAAAAGQRASLLAIVASAVAAGAQSGGVAPAPAALESTASLVSQLVSSPAQLSGAGAASALAVLSSIAGAGAAVSPAAAQSVAAALTSVAFAPAGASSGSSGSSNDSSSGGNFGAVLDVLDSLASSQASGLQVPGQAPSTVSTSAIQMSVALDAPDSPRLFTLPLTAPGSSSAFDALPPGALDGAGAQPVSTLFLSLAFDAHGGAASNNTGGVTRLAFASAASGAAVDVANLSRPLLFTMPASPLAGGQRTSCAWWDAATLSYNAAGCAALPSPFPQGHTLAFVDGFVSNGAASLAAAWNISGPLLDGCTPAFLDCTNATQRLTGSLQAGGASTAAAVTCGNASDIVLRAYLGGAACALANANNAAGCAWDVITQAFAGAGCVAANTTRCACTHLTDFTSSQAVNIPVCSLSDLVGLNPADIGARPPRGACVRATSPKPMF
jgi:hypothetical protein